jgi:hypothetical protein
MADRGFSNDELRLYELLQQFFALSDDPTVAGRIIVLGSDGNIVGDASLSATDIEAATDALLKLNVQRADASDPAAAPLPVDDDITDEVSDVMAGFDTALAALLDSEGGQA